MCGTSPQGRLKINETLELDMVHHVAGHDSVYDYNSYHDSLP